MIKRKKKKTCSHKWGLGLLVCYWLLIFNQLILQGYDRCYCEFDICLPKVFFIFDLCNILKVGAQKVS